jgi:hypothetical protein
MSSLTIEYLILLLNDYKNYSCFIETNTNEGITVLNLEPFFLIKYILLNVMRNIII